MVASRILFRDNQCMKSSGGTYTGDGGALYMNQCGDNLYWYNVTFDDNRAVRGGGVFNNQPASQVDFQNCLWMNNEAWVGGGFFNNGAAVTNLAHCTLAYNKATTPAGYSQAGGSAFYNAVSGGTQSIGSSILFHNQYTQLQSGGPPLVSAGTIGGVTSTVSATYSCVELDALPAPPWFGSGCIALDPQFTNGPARILTLQSSSPCIDAADDTDLLPDYADLDGNGTTGNEWTPLDARNNQREVEVVAVPDTGVDGGNISNKITDMGAFEVQ